MKNRYKHTKHTPRGQAVADGSVQAGLVDTGVGVEDAAQLHLTQAGYLSVTAPLVLEGQLVPIQYQRTQTALEAILGPWRDPSPPCPLPGPRPLTLALRLAAGGPDLGPKEKGGV